MTMSDLKKPFDAGWDQAEPAARYKAASRAVEDMKAAYERIGPATQAELAALVLGAKPALLHNGHGIDHLKLIEAAEKNGIDVMELDGMVLEPGTIRMRVVEEAELAGEVGWDERRTFEENVRLASPSFRATPEAQALMGFLLGFPASSVRGWKREQELERQGVPTLRQLTGSLGRRRSNDQVDVSTWSERDQELLRDVARGLGEIEDRVKGAELKGEEQAAFENGELDQLMAEFGGDLRAVYKTRFRIADGDIDLMLGRRAGIITAPDGWNAYTFAAYGKDGRIPDDVEELRKKVHAAFEDAGWPKGH